MSVKSWLETFCGNPARAVNDLFSGRAGAGSDLSLDIPEFLRQTFPPDLARERGLLDDALSNWLEDMREDYTIQVARLGFSVYGKRIADALIALQLLDLPETRHRIRTNVDPWLRWLLPLRLAPERDPALECRRLLTRGQPDARHTAMWLRLASDLRPEYLTVALVGLQLLPDLNNDPRAKQRLMLQALLRHAVSGQHDVSAALSLFNNRYGALRGRFPRTPAHWDGLLDEALVGFTNSTQERVTRALARQLRSGISHRNKDQPLRKIVLDEPVLLKEKHRLKSDIADASHEPETLARRLFELLDRNHNDTEITGDSHLFVRTLHELGHQLLRCHQLGEPAMARLGLMIERALAWEPMNPRCWMLWTDWFAAQGQLDACEWTLREMLRLFPDDKPSRVELARLLKQRGQDYWDEAEYWLRQVMERATNNESATGVMTDLRVQRGRAVDMYSWRAELPRFDRKRITRYSHDPWGTVGGSIAVDVPLVEGTRSVGAGVSIAHPCAVLQELDRRGRLAGEFTRARIAGAVPSELAATERIRDEAEMGDPLAGFCSQWLMPDETPACPPHAWAWRACLYWQKSEQLSHWRELAEEFPEAACETEFLRIFAASKMTDNGKARQTDVTRWHDRYGSNSDTPLSSLSPLVEFMTRELERVGEINPDECEEIACTVMLGKAVDVPEFTPGPADQIL